MKHYLVILFFLSATIQAQIINFPDANFKARLMLSGTTESIARNANGDFVKIDVNSDNEIDLTEAAAIQFLQINSANINSISGIENFISLRGLECGNNNLTTLPVGALVYLKYLGCYGNHISSLTDIENLIALEDLSIGSNPLTTINLQNLHQLWRVEASDTLLSEINLCGTSVDNCWAIENPNLTALYLKNGIVSNDLAKADLQIPPPLHNFEFYNSPLLTFICYDEGEYDAVLHGISYNTTGKTLTTSCDANCSLSVDDILQNTISLYPNPTSGIINIVVSNNQSFNKIIINNVLGQTIMTFGNTTILDISALTKGTYFVTVETESGEETQRIIKL